MVKFHWKPQLMKKLICFQLILLTILQAYLTLVSLQPSPCFYHHVMIPCQDLLTNHQIVQLQLQFHGFHHRILFNLSLSNLTHLAVVPPLVIPPHIDDTPITHSIKRPADPPPESPSRPASKARPSQMPASIPSPSNHLGVMFRSIQPALSSTPQQPSRRRLSSNRSLREVRRQMQNRPKMVNLIRMRPSPVRTYILIHQSTMSQKKKTRIRQTPTLHLLRLQTLMRQ